MGEFKLLPEELSKVLLRTRLSFKFFDCKHWWEVIYKPVVFLLTYIAILVAIRNIFNAEWMDYNGDGNTAIYLTPVVFLCCLISYIRNIRKSKVR